MGGLLLLDDALPASACSHSSLTADSADLCTALLALGPHAGDAGEVVKSLAELDEPGFHNIFIKHVSVWVLGFRANAPPQAVCASRKRACVWACVKQCAACVGL